MLLAQSLLAISQHLPLFPPEPDPVGLTSRRCRQPLGEHIAHHLGTHARPGLFPAACSPSLGADRKHCALLPPPAPRAAVRGSRAGFGTRGHWRPPLRGRAAGGTVSPSLPRGHWEAWARPQHGGPSPPPRFSSPIPGEGLPRGVRLHLRLPTSRADPQG